MALRYSCPHCASPLLVPENCGGQKTKCPKCSRSFVIPEDEPAAPAAVCAVASDASPPTLAPPPAPTGPAEARVSEAELEQAQRRFAQLAAEHVELKAELARRERIGKRRRRWALWLERFQAGRQRLDQTASRGGGLLMCTAAGGAVLATLAVLFGASALGLLLAAVLGVLLAGLAYLPFSYYPDDGQLAAMLPAAREKSVEATNRYEELLSQEAGQAERLAAAEQTYQQLKKIAHSRIEWLRSCQWQQMSSKSLVGFLVQVFQEHGYTVEATQKKGQAGLDLVVTREGRSIGVQVKGAPTEPLDQRLVQQTHDGRSYYKCQASALITNGQFLPSARQLADRLGCTLIDAAKMPELVEGRSLL